MRCCMSQVRMLIVIAMLLSSCDGGNILAVFPFSARSHFIMFEALIDELANRGHKLTVMSHFPRPHPRPNCTDISLNVPQVYSRDNRLNLAAVGNTPYSVVDNLYKLYKEMDDYKPIFQLGEVIRLIHSEDQFDLIITELFNTDVFLGFAAKFDAPFVAMSASPLMPWAHDRFRDPHTLRPVALGSLSDPMSLPERLTNTFHLVLCKLAYKYWFLPESERVARKYFGDIPALSDIARNTSLVLVNTHFSLHGSHPVSQNVIQVGGIHIKPKKKLPQDLEEFISGSEDGVIVFSMGSMFRSETLPSEKRLVFQETFARLKQRVIWKWEGPMANLSANIKLVRWLPQRDILEEEKVKVFIYHGGLLGVSEAVYCGVPILGLPLYGDMAHNLAMVKAHHAAIILNYSSINSTVLQDALYQLIYNKSYKENAVRLSRLFRDRPLDPLSQAVYWTEYVMRHRGAAHLRPPYDPLTWTDHSTTDILVISSLLAILSAALYILLHSFYFLVHTFTCSNGKKIKIT